MMRTTTRRTRFMATAALLASLTLVTTACGGDDSDSDSGSSSNDWTPSASESPSESAMADASAELVGPGCAAYAEQVPDGAGSVEGMSQDPVATAASNNPLLKTLTAAVSGQLNPEVNLVDTLNGGEFTVFAPTDSAFAKIDPATIQPRAVRYRTDSALPSPGSRIGARGGGPGQSRMWMSRCGKGISMPSSAKRFFLDGFR